MRKGEAGRSVGVSCRDFVPPEKAWPFQVVQVGGIAENPRAFGRCLPPAREHKTPTEGTATGIHRPAPENQRFRHSGFYTFQLKICCPPADKVFGSTPFSKGVAGCRAGSPAKSDGIQGGEPCKEGWIAGQELCEERRGLGEKTMERMFFRRHTLFWKHCIDW